MPSNNPKATDTLKSWKPGQSGNPAGKPKGALNLSTHIKNMLNDEEFSMWLQDPREGFIEYKGAPVKAIVNTTIKLAADKGKDAAAAREWLAKYGYGTKIEVEHSGEINTTKSLSDDELNERIADALKRRQLPD